MEWDCTAQRLANTLLITHTQTKPATAPTVHEHPQVPMWSWVLASGLTHTYMCACSHTPDGLDRLWKECEITLLGLLLTTTLDELKSCWLLNLKRYEWRGALWVQSLRLCVVCLLERDYRRKLSFLYNYQLWHFFFFSFKMHPSSTCTVIINWTQQQ